jgi:hypothetical protein
MPKRKPIEVTEAEEKAFRELLVERYGYIYEDEEGRVLLGGRPLQVIEEWRTVVDGYPD